MLLSELARDRQIRYFLISFTDLLGVQRAKLVPAQSIDQMAENGAGFAGFAAWLNGIEGKIAPGDRADYNNYTQPPSAQVKHLPTNLLDALRCLESNSVLAKAMGESLVNAYLKLQYQQWHQYSSHVTDWELDNTLNC
jgi:glutamine synthetase